MCIAALYCKPRTLRVSQQHKVYPYLLRHKPVTHSKPVWARDITHVRMHKGRVCLCRGGLVQPQGAGLGGLSNTMDVQFCVQALQEFIVRWGTPATFNTDQGRQFTSAASTGQLKRQGIRISMDGKGVWRDNVFVERLWRSLKDEENYLQAYDSVRTARCVVLPFAASPSDTQPSYP